MEVTPPRTTPDYNNITVTLLGCPHHYRREPGHRTQPAMAPLAALRPSISVVAAALRFRHDGDLHHSIDVGVQVHLYLVLAASANRAFGHAHFLASQLDTRRRYGFGDVDGT